MKINLNGPLVSNDEKWFYDRYKMEAFCPKDIMNAIEEANGEELVLNINSPGGDVHSASEIRSALKEYRGTTKAVITGLAASAATIVMTGCDTVEAYCTAVLMVHQASCYAEGNATDFDAYKKMLNQYDLSVANAYSQKTGKSVDECLKLMKNTTFMNAQDAKEKGFVDAIADETEELAAVASLGGIKISNKMKQIAATAKMGHKVDNDALAEMIIQKMEAKKAAEKEKIKNDLLKDLDRFGK